jgi:hypothetical protein
VRFVRRQPGGGLETILFDLGPDLPIQRNISAGILDDDTVIVAVDVGDGEYAILTSDGTSPRLLATGSDPLLPGGPFGFMTLLSVVGERAVILAETADNSAQRTLSYTEAAGFVPFFADQVDRNLRVATAGGRALVEQIRDGELTQFLFSPDGSGSLLTEYRGMGEPRAVGINDRDNVLFLIDGTQLGTRPHLSLAGPTPSARCPRLAPATETPSATQTPTPMETPTSTQTLAPTGTAQSTETAAPTQTAEPTETVPSTQTATHTATAVSASPTAADSLEFNDGCEVVPPRRATGWALLPPVFLVLVRGLARFRNRKVCRATRPRLFKRRC